MRKCRKCGGILEENAHYCILCGEKVELPPPTMQNNNDNDNNVEDPQAALLNNPSNYPNSMPTINVPSDANINVNERTVSNTPIYQSMPDVVPDSSQSETNQNKIFNVTTKKTKKRKTGGVKTIYIIAGVVAIIVLTIVSGYITYIITSNNNPRIDTPTTPKLNLNAENSYRVGSKDYGYVSVPNSWVQFGIEPDNQTIQYTDGAGWIVTLYSVGKDTISPRDWANSIVSQMNSVGAVNITIKETNINNYNGYKVFGYYENLKTYLSAWVIEGTDDKIHYVAVEGPEENNPFYDIVYTFDITNKKKN